MDEGISGREAGERNARRLASYLSETPCLPTYRGVPNARAVAKACGFASTGVIYNNPACRQLWDERLRDTGAAGIETQLAPLANGLVVDGLRAELSDSRGRVVALQAEVRALREKLSRLRHIERHLLSEGRLAR